MRHRERLYDAMLVEHLSTHRQMAFVTGPRQVGKTTTCRDHAAFYANWDNIDDREQILGGPAKLVERLKLNRLSEAIPIALFDELHKDMKNPVSVGDRVRVRLDGDPPYLEEVLPRRNSLSRVTSSAASQSPVGGQSPRVIRSATSTAFSRCPSGFTWTMSVKSGAEKP